LFFWNARMADTIRYANQGAESEYEFRSLSVQGLAQQCVVVGDALLQDDLTDVQEFRAPQEPRTTIEMGMCGEVTF
jgi:hypothetical protein